MSHDDLDHLWTLVFVCNAMAVLRQSSATAEGTKEPDESSIGQRHVFRRHVLLYQVSWHWRNQHLLMYTISNQTFASF